MSRPMAALRWLGGLLVCVPVLTLAQLPHEQAPLRDASVDTMIERLAPPASTATVRSLRNLVPQPQGSQVHALPDAPRQLDLVVNFDFDSAKLSEGSRQLLDKLAQALASPRLAGSRFRIEGHTDAKGSAAYNLALSQRRAKAVADHVVGLGVPAERLESVGLGFESLLLKDQPFAAENRRVRIVAVD